MGNDLNILLEQNKNAMVLARNSGDEESQRILSQEKQKIKTMIASRCSVCGRRISLSSYYVHGYVTRYCNMCIPHRLSVKFLKTKRLTQ